MRNFVKDFVWKLIKPLVESLFGEKIKRLESEIDKIWDSHIKTSKLAKEASEKLTPKKAKEILDPNLYELGGNLKIRITLATYSKDHATMHISHPCWDDGRPGFRARTPLTNNSVEYYNDQGKTGSWYFTEATPSCQAFIKKMFLTNSVSEISGDSAFQIQITKPGSLSWEEVIPKLNKAISEHIKDIKKSKVEPEEKVLS